MGNKMTRRTLTTFLAAPIVLLAFPVLAEDVAPNMTGSLRLAIGGYDTVAYHTMGKAVPARLEYQTIWHDARWQFSSQENLGLFIKDPEKYAARYDGHCAMGVAYENGHKDTVDPEAFTVVDVTISTIRGVSLGN